MSLYLFDSSFTNLATDSFFKELIEASFRLLLLLKFFLSALIFVFKLLVSLPQPLLLPPFIFAVLRVDKLSFEEEPTDPIPLNDRFPLDDIIYPFYIICQA